MGWCWAGLVMVAAMGLSLADARDLLSPTEPLWRINLGRWDTAEELGVEDVSWSFVATPLAAWWGMGVGGLMGLVGWQSARNHQPLPFGWIGAGIWLATLGQLFAANLLVQLVMFSLQAMCCAGWWARHVADKTTAGNLRVFLASTLAGDVLGLWGMLLAGLAWGTLSVWELSDADTLSSGWRSHPGWCGLAGIFLFLGVLGRGGLFPFLQGTRIAAQAAGNRCALIFSCCLWPSLMWHVLRITPLLSVAPETVSLGQGLSLLAAGAAAFVATAQSDRNHIVALLATSQIALLLSVIVVPDTVSPVWLLLMAVALGLSTAALFASRFPPFSAGWCWWILAGGCLSPVFWMSIEAIDQFDQWPADFAQREVPSDQAMMATSDEAAELTSYRVRPLPVITWSIAWCVASCFGAYAAWRGWRLDAGLNEAESPLERSATASTMLSVIVLSLLAACAGAAAWLVVQNGVGQVRWPIGAAILSSLAGGALAWWVCRDPQQMESRFQNLGRWPDWARREMMLPELAGRLRNLFLLPLVRLACWLDEWLQDGGGRTGTEIARRAVQTGEELQNESDVFYAVALAMIIGSLVVTWWMLAG